MRRKKWELESESCVWERTVRAVCGRQQSDSFATAKMGKVSIPSPGVPKLASLWGQYLDNLELSKRAFDLGPYLMEAKLGSQAFGVRSPLQSTPAGPLQMVVASWPTSRCSKPW